MNVKLKSKELIEFFGNNGIVTPTMAKNRLNNITIRLEEPITEELISDLYSIGYHFPELFRNTTIENASNQPINMQEIVDLIGSIQIENKGVIPNLESISIQSEYPEDYGLTFGQLGEFTTLYLDYRGTGLLDVTGKTSGISKKTKKVTCHGIDLSTLDLRGTNIKIVELTGNNSGFNRIKGLDQVIRLNLIGENNPQVIQEAVNFAATSPNLYGFKADRTDLSREGLIFRRLHKPNITDINIRDSNLSSVDGIEEFDNQLATCYITEPNIEIEKINEMLRKNPNVQYGFHGRNLINLQRQVASTRPTFSRKTIESLAENVGARNQNVSRSTEGILDQLFEYRETPYSIHDAKIVRGEAKITENPMMLEQDSDLDTFDFSQSYLQGGTVLLTVAQIEKLIASGKKLPINVGIMIHDTTELSSQKLEEIYEKYKITEVRMVGPDLVNTERNAYSPALYRRLRNIIDEVTAGINPSEPDIDRFMTVYERVTNSMYYDMDAIYDESVRERQTYTDRINSARNLENGLKLGTCVCAGYAEILRNALNHVNIENKFLTGYVTAPNIGGHAWNQVCIPNEQGVKEWFYVDSTWDSQLHGIKYCLAGEGSFHREHQVTKTRNTHIVRNNDYDRSLVQQARQRARSRLIDVGEVRRRQIAESEEKRRQAREKAERLRNEEINRKKTRYKTNDFETFRNLVRQRNELARKIRETNRLLIEARKNGLEQSALNQYENMLRTSFEEYEVIRAVILEDRDQIVQNKNLEISRKKQNLQNMRTRLASMPDFIETTTTGGAAVINPDYLEKARAFAISDLRFKISLRSKEAITAEDNEIIENMKAELAQVRRGEITPTVEKIAKEAEIGMLQARLRQINRIQRIKASRPRTGNPATPEIENEWAELADITRARNEAIQRGDTSEELRLNQEHKLKIAKINELWGKLNPDEELGFIDIDDPAQVEMANQRIRSLREELREITQNLNTARQAENREEINRLNQEHGLKIAQINRILGSLNPDTQAIEQTGLTPELQAEVQRIEQRIQELQNGKSQTSARTPNREKQVLQEQISALEREIQEDEDKVSFIEMPNEEIKREDLALEPQTDGLEIFDATTSSTVGLDPNSQEYQKRLSQYRESVDAYTSIDTYKYANISTLDDVKEAEKEHRIEYLSQRILDLRNRIFGSEKTELPKPIQTVINFGVSARMKIAEITYQATHKGKSKYEDELEAIKQNTTLQTDSEVSEGFSFTGQKKTVKSSEININEDKRKRETTSEKKKQDEMEQEAERRKKAEMEQEAEKKGKTEQEQEEKRKTNENKQNTGIGQQKMQDPNIRPEKKKKQNPAGQEEKKKHHNDDEQSL